jgi:hypothetical protein
MALGMRMRVDISITFVTNNFGWFAATEKLRKHLSGGAAERAGG